MESAIGRRNDDEGQDKASAPLATAAGDGMLVPTDMLREILLRLPAGEVCRLRLVCRSWRSLTSDPSFADAHARRHPLIAGLDRTTHRALHILDAMSGSILRRIPLPRRGVGLSTARPDLVCVSLSVPCSLFDGPSFILNPTTGAVTAMPKNVESPFLLLGLVPATGEHKVLRFNLKLESTSRVTVQHCRVVTLGANRRWRAAPRPAVHVEWRHPTDRVVVGGVAYFLPRTSLPNSAGIDPDTVAAFDLATEEWRPAMAGPISNGIKLSYNKHRLLFGLAKLDDCLVVVHHHCEDCWMDLWFLVDAGQGLWAKKHSIRCEPSCRRHSCGPPHPLAVLHDGRIVFRVERQVIRAYDPSTSLWADLVRLGEYYSHIISIHEGSFLLGSCLQPVKPDPFR